MDEGLPKLHLIHTCLKLRRDRPELFTPESTYSKLETPQLKTHELIAFLRSGKLLTVAPLHTVNLDWQDSSLALPTGTWTNLLTQETYPAGPSSLRTCSGTSPWLSFSRHPTRPSD